ncbi:MAG: MBL fold metallo-hydrolase, partial [Desulfobacteraceae bacterium]
TLLFDTGYSPVGVPHNVEQLEVNLAEIEAIILSHGHMDHAGSLYTLLDKLTKPVRLYLHPGAFIFPRYYGLDDGRMLLFPRALVAAELEERGAEIVETKGPTLLAEDMVMITGEVERSTAFEKGLPNALVEKNGKIEKDRIPDDQALVIHLRDKGLVVISGCSHAGIINTLLFAKKTTGIERIHGVLGGFHLSGPSFESIIEETIVTLKGMDPKVVVPMHCTGWNAVERFSEEFPNAFILNSVGSKITLLCSQFHE